MLHAVVKEWSVWRSFPLQVTVVVRLVHWDQYVGMVWLICSYLCMCPTTQQILPTPYSIKTKVCNK